MHFAFTLDRDGPFQNEMGVPRGVQGRQLCAPQTGAKFGTLARCRAPPPSLDAKFRVCQLLLLAGVDFLGAIDFDVINFGVQ